LENTKIVIIHFLLSTENGKNKKWTYINRAREATQQMTPYTTSVSIYLR